VIKVRQAVASLGSQIQVEAFSSLSNIGVEKLAQTLTNWYVTGADDSHIATDEQEPAGE
jgi:GTP-binding protein